MRTAYNPAMHSRALVALLLLPLAAEVSGCYGPCSTPIILAPLGWIAKSNDQTPSTDRTDPADLPPDAVIDPHASPIDIRGSGDRLDRRSN